MTLLQELEDAIHEAMVKAQAGEISEADAAAAIILAQAEIIQLMSKRAA